MIPLMASWNNVFIIQITLSKVLIVQKSWLCCRYSLNCLQTAVCSSWTEERFFDTKKIFYSCTAWFCLWIQNGCFAFHFNLHTHTHGVVKKFRSRRLSCQSKRPVWGYFIILKHAIHKEIPSTVAGWYQPSRRWFLQAAGYFWQPCTQQLKISVTAQSILIELKNKIITIQLGSQWCVFCQCLHINNW